MQVAFALKPLWADTERGHIRRLVPPAFASDHFMSLCKFFSSSLPDSHAPNCCLFSWAHRFPFTLPGASAPHRQERGSCLVAADLRCHIVAQSDLQPVMSALSLPLSCTPPATVSPPSSSSFYSPWFHLGISLAPYPHWDARIWPLALHFSQVSPSPLTESRDLMACADSILLKTMCVQSKTHLIAC